MDTGCCCEQNYRIPLRTEPLQNANVNLLPHVYSIQIEKTAPPFSEEVGLIFGKLEELENFKVSGFNERVGLIRFLNLFSSQGRKALSFPKRAFKPRFFSFFRKH